MLHPHASTEMPSSGEPRNADAWPEPAGWRTVDESVTLRFVDHGGISRPQLLRWRGCGWQVVGATRHWTTWHSLAVESADRLPPTTAGFRTSFWRFTGQTNPVSPVFHFEVRGAGCEWRLVRLGAVFDLPLQP